MPAFWTIHPAIYGSNLTGLDLSPLRRFARLSVEPPTWPSTQHMVFGVTTAPTGHTAAEGFDIDETMTQGDMEAVIAAKQASTGTPLSNRIAYIEDGTLGWSLAKRIAAVEAGKAAVPTWTWGHYFTPFTHNGLTGPGGTLTQLQADNNAIATLISACQIHLPDFYWDRSYSRSRVPNTFSLNMTEVRRAITNASAASRRIAPFITWTMNASDDFVVSAELVKMKLIAFAAAGLHEFVLWAFLSSTTAVSAFNEWVQDFADAMGRLEDRRAIQTRLDAADPRAAQKILNDIGAMVEPTPEVGISVASEGAYTANTRRFTIQVKDRLGQAWAGRWLVLVYITTEEGGDPSATGNTASFSAGTVVQQITANASYLVLTDPAGVAELDVTVAGAATRHVYAEVLGKPAGSGAATWAA